MNNEMRTTLRSLRTQIQAHIATLTKTGLDCDSVDDDALEELWKQTEPVASALDTIHDDLSELRDDEQNKFENLSEGLQLSDMGQSIEQAAQQLDYACDAVYHVVTELGEFVFEFEDDGCSSTDIEEEIKTAVENLEEAVENINEAIGD